MLVAAQRARQKKGLSLSSGMLSFSQPHLSLQLHRFEDGKTSVSSSLEIKEVTKTGFFPYHQMFQFSLLTTKHT